MKFNLKKHKLKKIQLNKFLFITIKSNSIKFEIKKKFIELLFNDKCVNNDSTIIWCTPWLYIYIKKRLLSSWRLPVESWCIDHIHVFHDCLYNIPKKPFYFLTTISSSWSSYLSPQTHIHMYDIIQLTRPTAHLILRILSISFQKIISTLSPLWSLHLFFSHHLFIYLFFLYYSPSLYTQRHLPFLFIIYIARVENKNIKHPQGTIHSSTTSWYTLKQFVIKKKKNSRRVNVTGNPTNY